MSNIFYKPFTTKKQKKHKKKIKTVVKNSRAFLPNPKVVNKPAILNQ